MSYIIGKVIVNAILVNKESDVEKHETDNIKNLIYTIREKSNVR